MHFIIEVRSSLRTLVLFGLSLHSNGIAQQQKQASTTPTPFPAPETATYRIEWRMVTAGAAKLQLTRSQQDWQIRLDLASAGLVSRLFRVEDTYKVTSNDKFCGINSSFEAREGKRHVIEAEQFDNTRHKATFDIHNLAKSENEHYEIDIAPCTHEVIGALQSLRALKLDAGKFVTVPIVNGKKMAYAKIEAQAKELLTIDGRSYSTMRYEAFIFDNVVFRRKGSLLVWLSDDASQVPVQMRFQMGFPIGTITLELEKVERS